MSITKVPISSGYNPYGCVPLTVPAVGFELCTARAVNTVVRVTYVVRSELQNYSRLEVRE
jgi:hypothetical protein